MLCKQTAACRAGMRDDDVSNPAAKTGKSFVLLSPHGHELVNGHKAGPVAASQTEQGHFPVKGALAGLQGHKN